MPRIKLEPQPNYRFQHTITVRVTDLNYGKHLSNDAIVRFLHETRVLIFAELGVEELDLGDGRTGIIMGDLVVNYLGEGFLFDEIVVESQIGEISRRSFRLYHRLSCGSRPIALAETGIVTFDYTTRQTASIPEPFRQAIIA